ncbi:hypothetical protein HDV00_010853, partial [Rhizophlyctis rosea]
MLHREGVTLDPNGRIVPEGGDEEGSCLVEKITTDMGNAIYAHRLTGEMGLGKTVMLLALLCLHRPSTTSVPTEEVLQAFRTTKMEDELPPPTPPKPKGPLPTSATLVITPSAILDQWISEIQTHAPHLSVYAYQGITHHHSTLTRSELASHDVVLTTYEVLRKEFHFAKSTPDRARRFERKYERQKSVLVEIGWWRVVLDEAQMVDNPVTQSAEMAGMVPKLHPWVVTGTPFGKLGMGDLYGLLVFLNLQPFSTLPPLWKRLTTPYHAPHLFTVLRRVMHRNTEANLKEELTLPPQTESVVRVEFEKVEREVYGQIWEMCLEDVRKGGGEGRRLVEGEEEARARKGREDVGVMEKMGKWLLQLRQACCHPQLGRHNQRMFGGELKSIGEVLTIMVKQAVTNVQTAERNLYQSMIYRAQLDEYEKSYARPMQIYTHLVKEIRQRVSDAENDVATLKARRAQLSRSTSASAPPSFSDMDDSDAEDDSQHSRKSGEVDSLAEEIGSATNRLHSWEEMEHRVLFFTASLHHMLKNEAEETEYYALAEKMRRRILKPAEEEIAVLVAAFQKQVDNLRARVMSDGGMVMTVPKLRGGIVVGELVREVSVLVDKLNGQWKAIEEWRGKSLEALLARLEDAESGEGEGEGKPSGEEYERGMNVQEEGFRFQDLYMRAVSDRRQVLCGMRGTDEAALMEQAGAASQVPKRVDGRRGGKKYWTAEELLVSRLEDAAVWEKATEYKVARERESLELRKPFLLGRGENCLRKVLGELKAKISGSGGGGYVRGEEVAIAQEVLNVVGRECDRQVKKLDVMEKELRLFNRVYNLRLSYYAQLQRISDGVTLPDAPVDIGREREEVVRDEVGLQGKVGALVGRRRYLEFLEREEGGKGGVVEREDGGGGGEGGESSRVWECGICQGVPEKAVLTVCGHLYCSDCLKAWVTKWRKCPLCKHPLLITDIQLVMHDRSKSLHPPLLTEGTPSSDHGASSSSSSSSPSPSTNDATTTRLLHTLRHIHLTGSYGTKLDTIIRHVIHLRREDPTVKALVFSQWEGVLGILERGMKDNGVGCVKLEGGKGGKGKAVVKFKEDDEVAVFLLHGRSQSAGLTL